MAEVQLPWTKKPSRPARRKGGRGPSDDASETRGASAAPADAPPQSPLDFTLAVMRDPLKPDALRASLAKAALPYVHGRWCPLGSDPRDALLLPHREAGKVPSASSAGGVLASAPTQRASRVFPPPQAGEGEERSQPHDASAHDAMEQRAIAESALRESEQRALKAEARMRESEQRAVASEAGLIELAAMFTRVKNEWPDIFDASGAVRAPAASERDGLAQLVAAQERARNFEERAIAAEGALREAQFRARDMEQRACAAEELIAGRR